MSTRLLPILAAIVVGFQHRAQLNLLSARRVIAAGTRGASSKPTRVATGQTRPDQTKPDERFVASGRVGSVTCKPICRRRRCCCCRRRLKRPSKLEASCCFDWRVSRVTPRASSIEFGLGFEFVYVSPSRSKTSTNAHKLTSNKN